MSKNIVPIHGFKLVGHHSSFLKDSVTTVRHNTVVSPVSCANIVVPGTEIAQFNTIFVQLSHPWDYHGWNGHKWLGSRAGETGSAFRPSNETPKYWWSRLETLYARILRFVSCTDDTTCSFNSHFMQQFSALKAVILKSWFFGFQTCLYFRHCYCSTPFAPLTSCGW